MSYTCQICGMFVSDFGVGHVCSGYRNIPTPGFTTTTLTTYIDPNAVERIAVALEAIAKALKPARKRTGK